MDKGQPCPAPFESESIEVTTVSILPTEETTPVGADAASTRQELDEMGPLTVFGCRVFLLISPLAMLGALVGVSSVPHVLYVLPALGAAAVAPRRVLLKIQVSLSLFMLLGWALMSTLWSIDEANSVHQAREQLAPVLGLVLVAGMLPVDETIRWFVRGIKLMLAVSLVGLVLEPDTAGGAWEAWFASKNNFGRSVALSLLTLLAWDRTVWSRLLWIAVSLVFVVGSSSATALAASIAALGLVFWVRRYQTVGQRWSGSFALASIAAGVAVLTGAFLSAAWVVRAFGRDLSFTGRTEIWDAGLDAVERRPLGGHGYGGVLFDGLTPESREVWRDIGFEAANAHSGLLQLTTDLGLPGLVLFFVLYVSTMAGALRLLRTSYVATWAFSFLWIQLLVGVVEPVFMNDWLAPLVLSWVLLSKVTTERRRAQDTWTSPSARAPDIDDLDLDIALEV